MKAIRMVYQGHFRTSNAFLTNQSKIIASTNRCQPMLGFLKLHRDVINNALYSRLMNQSIPAVNFPPRETIGGSHILLPCPRFFPKKFRPKPRFRSGQTFPEIDKNLQCIRISIFSQRFQEATENGKKNACFLSQ